MRPRAAACLLAGLLALIAVPGAQGLSLLERTPEEDALVLRLGLEEGQARARANEGQLSLDGQVLGDQERVLDGPTEAWRGHPRTLLVRATGQGQLLLSDAASGLVLDIRTEPQLGEGSANGSSDPAPGETAAGPPAGSSNRTAGAKASGAGNSTEAPTSGRNSQLAPTGPANASGGPAAEGEAPSQRLWPSPEDPGPRRGLPSAGWLGLAVGGLLLGASLAPRVQASVKRRAFQVKLVARRVLSRWRHREG